MYVFLLVIFLLLPVFFQSQQGIRIIDTFGIAEEEDEELVYIPGITLALPSDTMREKGARNRRRAKKLIFDDEEQQDLIGSFVRFL